MAQINSYDNVLIVYVCPCSKKIYIGVVLEYQSSWQALLLPIKVANIIAQSTNNNPNPL
jgi:hypothetical protein